MCLATNQSEVKIAEEDIPVWKVLIKKGNTLESPYYRNFKWERGTTYKSEMRVENSFFETFYVIEDALHSFLDKEKAKRLVKARATIWNEEPIIIDMIVPKGSEYYTNSHQNEIASNKLYFPKQEVQNVSNNT
jgi:hypothetical protein